tara:strand:+ start:14853 stop:15809 length:957 start_codon:yes stop_codon:yes gene_type:complete
MAVRRPIFLNNGNIQQMDDTMFGLLKDKFRYEFQQASPISLSVVSSGGSLGTLVDTRMISGGQQNNGSRFPTEAETPEPTSTSVSYAKITQSVASAPSITSDSGKRYFSYIDGDANVQVMSYQDMLDSIVRPVIDELTSGNNTNQQAGTYFIDTNSVASGDESLVSSTAVFIDTRANTSSFQASNIPSSTNATLDYPQTINNYYLKKNTISSPTLSVLPLKIRSDNDVQEFTTSEIATIANELMRNETIDSAGGYKIRYNINGTGTTKGSVMIDTRLTGGSGNYQQRQLHADDYRAMEFPDGTATTINSYTFKIQKTS